MGREIYWLTVMPLEKPAEGTDLWAMNQGFISITPLRLDLTDHAELARLQKQHPFQEGAPEPGPEHPTGDRAPIATG